MKTEMKETLMSVGLLVAGFAGGYLLYKAISGKDPLKEVATSATPVTPVVVAQEDIVPTEQEIGQAIAQEIIE